MQPCVKLVITVIVICFFSCNRNKSKVVWEQEVVAEPASHREDTILKNENDMSYFSRLYKQNSNGLISSYIIPDSIKEWDFKVVFTGKARTNYAYSNAAIMLAVMTEEKVMNVWTPLMLRYYFTETNNWCEFRDSITFKHETWQKADRYVNVFAYLGNSERENFDLQNLKVRIYAKEK